MLATEDNSPEPIPALRSKLVNGKYYRIETFNPLKGFYQQ